MIGAAAGAARLAMPCWAGHFGLGQGSGAHAPNEYYVIESTNPKIQGMDGAVFSMAEYLTKSGRWGEATDRRDAAIGGIEKTPLVDQFEFGTVSRCCARLSGIMSLP